MRLSFGFVRGDGLGCLYHGWQFGPTARCRLIPAHPQVRVPASIHVGAYGVREADGLVWVSPEAAEDFPLHDARRESGAITPVRSVHVRAGVTHLRQAIGGVENAPVVWHGRVGLAVHEPVAGQAMLHVVRMAGAEGPSPLFLSRWAGRLRDAVECGGETAPVMGELA
ncbi:Rieske 2Fe-2S domain-containing protein [Komagataeibacter kakiaceti]|uniref:Rieske 2Fe-2S domain-containing protein n=1 Tax=Komagataeibacter kakiaceti TaxID=943261 RepID=UPI001F58FCA3|nr:Rieske 2Fe-2S domain-containing protein [Komagataeibacter kakiaceti]